MWMNCGWTVDGLWMNCGWNEVPNCHLVITHCQVGTGGVKLQPWRMDVNVLNDQSWTADKG
jgi:hypothetical protein